MLQFLRIQRWYITRQEDRKERKGGKKVIPQRSFSALHSPLETFRAQSRALHQSMREDQRARAWQWDQSLARIDQKCCHSTSRDPSGSLFALPRHHFLPSALFLPLLPPFRLHQIRPHHQILPLILHRRYLLPTNIRPNTRREGQDHDIRVRVKILEGLLSNSAH